jgi:hypothetical protein
LKFSRLIIGRPELNPVMFLHLSWVLRLEHPSDWLALEVGVQLKVLLYDSYFSPCLRVCFCYDSLLRHDLDSHVILDWFITLASDRHSFRGHVLCHFKADFEALRFGFLRLRLRKVFFVHYLILGDLTNGLF